jgi:hypothetical protein
MKPVSGSININIAKIPSFIFIFIFILIYIYTSWLVGIKTRRKNYQKLGKLWGNEQAQLLFSLPCCINAFINTSGAQSLPSTTHISFLLSSTDFY